MLMPMQIMALAIPHANAIINILVINILDVVCFGLLLVNLSKCTSQSILHRCDTVIMRIYCIM